MRTTRTVKRFNYAKAAFYVYLLAMIIFIATNAAASLQRWDVKNERSGTNQRADISADRLAFVQPAAELFAEQTEQNTPCISERGA